MSGEGGWKKKNPNGNKAAVIFTLFPVQHLFKGSWSHHLGERHEGQSRTGYTFGRAKSASERPPLRRQTERLITISRSDLSNPRSSTGGGETKLFSPLNLTARRKTARQGVSLLFHPGRFQRGFTSEKQPNADAFYLQQNPKKQEVILTTAGGKKISSLEQTLISVYSC